MIEAARHQGRDPAAGLILRLLELHRQIDIAHLERAACIRAKDPDRAHPRQVPTLCTGKTTEESLDPLRRLRALHRRETTARLGGTSFTDALNSESVAEEIVASLIGSIGLIPSMPITTAIAALLAPRMSDKQLAEAHAQAH